MDNAQFVEDLNRLARRFEDNTQNATGINLRGWGQFLDAFKQHEQVGPYGTAAGIIVLSLAGRGESAPVAQARALLSYYWQHRNDTQDRAHRQFVQTIRLAFHHLALRLSGTLPADAGFQEVQSALFDRLLPAGLWGNYWVSNDNNDATPRVFPSAIALLSFTLGQQGSTLDVRLNTLARTLEEKLHLTRGLSELDTSAIIAALMASKGTALSRKTRRRIRRIARRVIPELRDQASYFFDFEHLPDSEQRIYGRDYFIVTPEILLAIGGFQAGAPTALRLLAERTVQVLNQNLLENGYAYHPTEESRISTVDQAWSAILLRWSAVSQESIGWGSRVWYRLARERKDNKFTGTIFPIVAMVIVTLGNVVLRDAGLYAKMFSAAALLFVGSLYGPRYFSRLFPGRTDTR